MDSAESVPQASYELAFTPSAASSAGTPVTKDRHGLPEALLARNVLWMCRLRWAIIGTLLLFGLAGRSDGLLERIGLNAPGYWPFVAVAVLTLGNVIFLAHVHFLKVAPGHSSTMTSLWSQIVFDLAILTAVVHYLGSTDTYVPFTYLFHIVLACIFFSRRRSMIVMFIASFMFITCVVAERMGILQARNVFIGPARQYGEGLDSAAFWLHTISAVGIWMVVWHLASGLSMTVRRRDSELVKTNRRLLAAQAERSSHMLATTHQLKSPFAAIHANTQLLMKGYCGELPDQAVEVVERISARCRRLATEIQEMLQLANLSSSGQQPFEQEELDLADLLTSGIEQVRTLADTRGIVFAVDLQPAPMIGVQEHLSMAFLNLLTNAVSYSYDGGEIRVSCRHEGGSRYVVTVSDDGIGIDADKLPRIFQEHYRTKNAVQHNKESSGLGLAIVRQVAEQHHIHLRVASALGVGTTFEMIFGSLEPDGPGVNKEIHDGTSDDSG